jgi:hypothetical protein
MCPTSIICLLGRLLRITSIMKVVVDIGLFLAALLLFGVGLLVSDSPLKGF